MNLNRYAAFSNSSHDSYEFLSIGPKGTVKKIVQYTEIERNVYNLAFGDWDELSQAFRDDIRTNNGDRGRVLATVASTVLDFMRYHPNAIVFAKGSIPAKTRLYQMGITTNWKDISTLLDVRGFTGKGWEPFRQGKNYKAFAAKAK